MGILLAGGWASIAAPHASAAVARRGESAAARGSSSTARYFTMTGPNGLPLAPGRPWGRACQPVRFTTSPQLPSWVYGQLAAVVAQARHDGIDVTVEDRRYHWDPSSLYYVSGQSPASTVRVAIFADNGAPPRLSNGQPEHIKLGWDTRTDPDGEHDDLTLVQGSLWMRSVDGNAADARRAIRQLIAMTQGISATDSPTSGISDASHVDGFTPADIAVMKQMSGCDGMGS